MTCVQECIRRCKKDRNIVIAGDSLYDFNNSIYTVVTNDADVENRNVSCQGDDGGDASSSSTSNLKNILLNRWMAVSFKLSCCFL